MDALLILISMLVPCISFYDGYIEQFYNTRYKDSTEERLTFTSSKPALFESSEFQYEYHFTSSYWLRTKKKKKKEQVYSTKEPKSPSLNMTFFPVLVNKQIQATKINETKYPWIARVVHSSTGDHPFLCSAACIEQRIFLTAARCIATKKLLFMSVLYQGTRLKPIALVVPSKPTKQMFDDIGFIIVDGTYKGKWQTIQVYDKLKRTDKNFKWFGNVSMAEGTAIGHVAEGGKPEIQYLYEIKVYISNYLCSEFYSRKDKNSYFVPCYHTCTLKQDALGEAECKKHLAGEGHIVLNAEKTKKIIGVATWGIGAHKATWHDFQMPVGMSVPNSEGFSEDLKCARKIRNAAASSKSFANLC